MILYMVLQKEGIFSVEIASVPHCSGIFDFSFFLLHKQTHEGHIQSGFLPNVPDGGNVVGSEQLSFHSTCTVTVAELPGMAGHPLPLF